VGEQGIAALQRNKDFAGGSGRGMIPVKPASIMVSTDNDSMSLEHADQQESLTARKLTQGAPTHPPTQSKQNITLLTTFLSAHKAEKQGVASCIATARTLSTPLMAFWQCLSSPTSPVTTSTALGRPSMSSFDSLMPSRNLIKALTL